MTFQSQALALTAPDVSRSALSREFEIFWHTLPKEGLIPERSAFRPERAARFLRHLILSEAQFEGDAFIRFRLVGSEFERRVQRDLKGANTLQFLQPAHQARNIRTTRKIATHPCGLWHVTPLHYERGYAQHMEFTTLPLGRESGGIYQFLVLTQPVDGLLTAQGAFNKAIRVDPALTFQYIDLGAGVPPERGRT